MIIADMPSQNTTINITSYTWDGIWYGACKSSWAEFLRSIVSGRYKVTHVDAGDKQKIIQLIWGST